MGHPRRARLRLLQGNPQAALDNIQLALDDGIAANEETGQPELLAANHSIEEMARLIDVDSLAFLSIDGLYRAVGEAGRNDAMPQYCDACYTGEYPIDLADHDDDPVPAQLSLLAVTGKGG